MIVVDTSIWVNLYRDRTGQVATFLAVAVGSESVAFPPFVVTELLQGARSEAEWDALSKEIGRIPKLDLPSSIWTDAARIYFDLQRRALTVRSTVDCLIAQLCLTHDCLLLHNDRDFERIAEVRPLRQQRLPGPEPIVHG